MPEEPLAAPAGAEIAVAPDMLWNVLASSERVNRSWEDLTNKAPKSSARCYEYLCTTPMTRYSGRVYPLKHKEYKGVWEYEVTGGDRLYYLTYAQRQR